MGTLKRFQSDEKKVSTQEKVQVSIQMMEFQLEEFNEGNSFGLLDALGVCYL